MPLEERRLFFSRSSNNPKKKQIQKKQVFKVARRPSSVTIMAATMNHWSSFTIQYSPKKWHPHAICCWGFFGPHVWPPKNPGCQWRPGGHIPKVKGLYKCFTPESTLKPVFPGSRTFFHAGSCDWNKHPNGFQFFFLLLVFAVRNWGFSC